MKFIWTIAALSLPLLSEAMEYDIQFENDAIRISKIKMLPEEKVGLHRDENLRVVYGIKGGVITRTEQDGSTREVHFPTGEATLLDADPVGELHTGANGPEELEVIVVEFKTKASQ